MDCLNTAWQAHAPELRHWMRRRLKNPAQADDLLQDVFLKALRQGRTLLFGPQRTGLAVRGGAQPAR